MQRRTVLGALVALAVHASALGAQGYTLEHAASGYDALIEQANAAHASGDIDAAIELLERALALDPERPEAHNNLGVAELDAGDYTRAADRFGALALLVRSMPAHDSIASDYYLQAHDGMLEAGGLLLDEGGLLEARDIFTRLIELFPESGDGRHNLALTYSDLEALDESAALARQMIEREPLSDAGWSFWMDALLGTAELTDDDDVEADALQRYDDVHAQAEALPLRLDGLLVDRANGTLTGRVIGAAADAGTPVTLLIRLHGRDGVLDERAVTLNAPGAGAEASFTVPAARAPVTGITYTIAE
jgi:tetratricopeptide (TPR) repeat protein